MNNLTPEQTVTVLIIDDNPLSLAIITGYLKKLNYSLLTTLNGMEGIQIAEQKKPNLILLDIMMSGIDGFEVCRRLKENEHTQNIPIIIITALNNEQDKIKGFELGAVDYITKPVRQQELIARVTNQLRMQRLTTELRESNQALRTANEALAKSNRDKIKFFSIIAHDLRNPVHPLLGFSQLLYELGPRLTTTELNHLSYQIYSITQRVSNLLTNLLQWAKIQMNHAAPYPQHIKLQDIVRENFELLQENAARKNIQLKDQLQKELWVYTDQTMLAAVLRNLLSNAIKFTPVHGQITVSAHPHPQFVEVLVIDTGVGIMADDVKKLFQLGTTYSTTGTNEEAGSGLGLLLCKEMVELNGGQISLESKPKQGTTVRFTIPTAPPE